MTGQPISNDSQDYRLYLESYLLVMKITDAEASVPGKGYRTQNEAPNLPMMEHGTGNTMAQLKASQGRVDLQLLGWHL